jgi:ligand-binding SRPBCC domain-containing protein
MFERTVRLRFTTEVEVDVQSLYDFHIDTNNLPKITPPWINVQIISLELPLHQGSELELDITRFGIRQRWKMQIAELKRPELVCDQAIKSPFASFTHHHRFEAIDGTKSRLCDELAFSLPFYPFSLIALPFVKHDIHKMFAYRHRQTKILLEKNHV